MDNSIPTLDDELQQVIRDANKAFGLLLRIESEFGFDGPVQRCRVHLGHVIEDLLRVRDSRMGVRRLQRDSWVATGATPEEAAQIEEEGLTVMFASRPTSAVWWDEDERRYKVGPNWQGRADWGLGFFVAGHPHAFVDPSTEKQLRDIWTRDGAYHVVLEDE